MRGPILTIYTPYDVFLRKEVPFGSRAETVPHLGQIPPNTISGHEEAFSSQTR